MSGICADFPGFISSVFLRTALCFLLRYGLPTSSPACLLVASSPSPRYDVCILSLLSWPYRSVFGEATPCGGHEGGGSRAAHFIVRGHKSFCFSFCRIPNENILRLLPEIRGESFGGSSLLKGFGGRNIPSIASSVIAILSCTFTCQWLLTPLPQHTEGHSPELAALDDQDHTRTHALGLFITPQSKGVLHACYCSSQPSNTETQASSPTPLIPLHEKPRNLVPSPPPFSWHFHPENR